MENNQDDMARALAESIAKTNGRSLNKEEETSNQDTNVEEKTETAKESEKKVENNSTQEPAKEETSKQEDTKPSGEDDFETKFSERFNNEIKDKYVPIEKVTEYETRLSELQKNLDEAKNAEPTFVSDWLQKLSQLDKQGIKVTPENANILTKDFSQVNFSDQAEALNLVRQAHQVEGLLEGNEIDRQLKKDFPVLFDPDAYEEEKADQLIDLRIAAKKAAKRLQEVQSNIKTTDSNSRYHTLEQAQEILAEQSAKESEQINAAYKQVSERLTKDLKTVSYDVADGKKIELELEDAQAVKEAIENIKYNPKPFFTTDAQGKPVFDEKKALQSAVNSVLSEKAIKAAYAQGLTDGAETNTNEYKNAKPSSTQSAKVVGDNDVAKSFMEAFKNSYTN